MKEIKVSEINPEEPNKTIFRVLLSNIAIYFYWRTIESSNTNHTNSFWAGEKHMKLLVIRKEIDKADADSKFWSKLVTDCL